MYTKAKNTKAYIQRQLKRKIFLKFSFLNPLEYNQRFRTFKPDIPAIMK